MTNAVGRKRVIPALIEFASQQSVADSVPNSIGLIGNVGLSITTELGQIQRLPLSSASIASFLPCLLAEIYAQGGGD